MSSINEGAPVKATYEVPVAADRATVWSVMADISGWPAWNKEIVAAELHGPLAPGSTFTWQAGKNRISSTLTAVEEGHEMAWTGSTMGIKAVHVWRILERDGRTYARVEESWEGLLVSLLRRQLRTRLETSLRTGTADIKAEAERRESET